MGNAAGAAGIVADLAGLATMIGTAIPGLKKAKKRDTSQRAAHQATSAVQAAAVGGAQTGQGATRGLALRSGLRSAANTARKGADAASTAAAQDEQRYAQEKDARNARLAEFGKGIGDMAANVAGGIVDAKAGRAAEDAERPTGSEDGYEGKSGYAANDETTPQFDAAALQSDFEGGSQQASVGSQTQQLQQQEQQGMQQVGSQEQQGDPNAYGAEPGPSYLNEYAPPVTAQDAYRQALGLPNRPVLALAPQLEMKLRVSNLIAQEADRMGIATTNILAQSLRQAQINPDLMDIDPGEVTAGGQYQNDEDYGVGDEGNATLNSGLDSLDSEIGR